MKNSCGDADRKAWPLSIKGQVYERANVKHRSFRWIRDHWEDDIDPDQTRRGSLNNQERPDPASIRRWMKGIHVPEEEKQRVQYEVVQHTYSIPQRGITRMMEVTDERAKATGGTKEERVDLWCDDAVWVRDAFQRHATYGNLHLYSLLIFAARAVNDFPTRLLSLLEKIDPQDEDGWQCVRDVLGEGLRLWQPPPGITHKL